MTRLAEITLVQDGRQVQDVEKTLAAAPWWVVRVRTQASPLWCVYGGNAWSITAAIRRHAEIEPIDAVVACSFADAKDSLVARAQMEKKFMTPGSFKPPRQPALC